MYLNEAISFRFLNVPNDFRSLDNLIRFDFLDVFNDFRSFDNLGSCSFHYGFFFPIRIGSVPSETLAFLAISTSR